MTKQEDIKIKFIPILRNVSSIQVANYLSGQISKVNKSNKIFKLAITGEGNSGKTTIAKEISKKLQQFNPCIIEIDNYIMPSMKRRR